ncbi:MAG: PadR family transcriptional regulator [Coriobacteriia bacterium]|nr:PadR family transcriptional regulator [Coriobacteriia bacterium]
MTELALTNAELVVLSLIYEGPKHGYEVEQEITRRNMRVWTDLATSSIYYVLGRLEEKGAIIPMPPPAKREGVPRKVYRTTAEGRKAWKAATLEALSHPTITYTSFLIGLHNLWDVDPTEALRAVRSYRDWLAADLARQRTALEELGVSFFPLDVLFDYSFLLGDAELRFLDELITRLEHMATETPGTRSCNRTREEGAVQDDV